MRKFLLFLAIVMVCVSGSTFAQGGAEGDATISLDNVTNMVTGSTTQLKAGKAHVFAIRYDASACNTGSLFIGTNAFELYSPDFADWGGLQGTYGPLALSLDPTKSSKFLQHYQAPSYAGNYVRTASQGTVPAIGYTPGVAEKVAFAVSTNSNGEDGWESGVDNGIAVYGAFSTRKEDDGLQMCIDSVFQQGTQAWEWTFGLLKPTHLFWDNGLGVSGPRCFEIFVPENVYPIWCTEAGLHGNPNGSDQDYEASVSFNHCDPVSFDLCAWDPEEEPADVGPITYSFAVGQTPIGELVANTGEWSWAGSTVPQSGFQNIEFSAFDGTDFTETVFTLHVTVENNPPTITCPGGSVPVTVFTTKSQTVTIGDPDDCDVAGLVLSIGTVINPEAGDVIDITGNVISFTPAGDYQRTVTMPVIVTDEGGLTATCNLEWFVGTGSPYQVEITKDSMTYQGAYNSIDIVLHKSSPVYGFGGFDFLIAYDASALSFQSALEGDIYSNCKWEYFTYRFGPDGVCGSGCPSGILAVTGMAESNNGPYHPICNLVDAGYVDQDMLPITLASLKFLVSNDRTLECNYVPVRFYWMECADNTISSTDGSRLFLSEKLYEFTAYNAPFDGVPLTGTYAFPTYGGTQETLTAEDCYFEDEQHNKFASPGIGFQNGGFDIACADSIDARGDINLNGLPYEIADAVMFTNYFVNGPIAAFGDHYEGSVAASDCNADGLALTVADLVYLIRVVIGDAQAIPKTSPMATKFSVTGDTYSIGTAAGAAYLVFEGSVTPTLLADNMKMQFAVVNGNTNVLIFRDDVANESFVGDFVRANGRLITSEFATYDGQPMVAKLVPTSFAVEQNYPNPFNPTTNISFNIPVEGTAWNLDIYNIAGQLVKTFSGVSEGGVETVTWDASGKASGIYFYKVTAGNNSETKKAVLLK